MKFNQMVIAPWIGDGSPIAQTFWVDDITWQQQHLPQVSPSQRLPAFAASRELTPSKTYN